MINQDNLDDIKAIYIALEDRYWRFNDLPGPDEDREDQLNQAYTQIHEKVDEILGSALF